MSSPTHQIAGRSIQIQPGIVEIRIEDDGLSIMQLLHGRRLIPEPQAVRQASPRVNAAGPLHVEVPILVKARPNARWSLDFVHDQFACGRRFQVLNIVDDITRECLAAIPDTSISGRRVARELTDLISRRGKPGMIVSGNILCWEFLAA
jgi:putative transposase